MSTEWDTSIAAASDEPGVILGQYDTLWQEFQATIASMSEKEMASPGRVGEWSAKDLLAHLGRWNDAAVTIIDDRLAGRPLGETYDDYEAWNARWAEEDRALTLQEARTRCESAHRRLRGLIAELAADRWDKVVRSWVRGSGVEHLEEHLADLRGAGTSS
jgi:hypothetical protein